MNNRTRWRFGALASAIALLGSLASLDAHALALGRITVLSALGEPLRAEIDIADINADEASSLKAGVASAETFKAAGFEYTSVMTSLEVNLQRRADGRAYLRLTSNRPVTEPFVDLILLANWSTGRITRDYTMLFDPPGLQARSAGPTAAPTAPILARPAAPIATPPARALAAAPYVAPSPPNASLSEKTSAGNKQVTVKAGDTAGKIAAQNKPASVSLDQMLLALLASNPDAFIGGNVNRVKSGAVLDIPDAQAAGAISPGEASQTIAAQSRDFNAFRRKLAESVPGAQVADADRQASGKVQAKVEDRSAASTTPDKLTLSKGAVQGKTAAAAEDKIARNKQAEEASARVAELSKNIGDLNKLGATTTPAATVPATTAPTGTDSSAKVPGVAVPLPAPANDSTGPLAAAVAPASASTSVTAPLVAAPLPAPTASVAEASTAAAANKPVVATPPPSEPTEPSLLDSLLENPLLMPVGGGLLVLLIGLGFYRYRKRNGAGQVDSSFLESRLQPDSFFGASGGQRIDTNDGNITGSSLVYSPSQLDAAGDVDPVAEADVYLAYGRDLQAEEILKEALRTSPTRVAIHAKLLEIYAKRRDSRAFEAVAIEAFNLTRGNGPEWAYISEMGRELDPANPMYSAGGQPVGASPADGAAAFPSAPAQDAQATKPEPEFVPASAPVVDVDLDLDFSLDEEPDMATSPAAIGAHLPDVAKQAPAPDQAMKSAPAPADLDLNFDSAEITPSTGFAATPAARPVDPPVPDLSFSPEGLSFTPERFVPPKPVVSTAPVAPPSAAESGMLEFDLASLSLDLSGPATESPAQALTPMPDDPLETRFLLAEEFRSLGDAEGARALAEEVLTKARGPLKVKAQAFLNALA